jgi:hypothetical protein
MDYLLEIEKAIHEVDLHRDFGVILATVLFLAYILATILIIRKDRDDAAKIRFGVR